MQEPSFSRLLGLTQDTDNTILLDLIFTERQRRYADGPISNPEYHQGVRLHLPSNYTQNTTILRIPGGFHGVHSRTSRVIKDHTVGGRMEVGLFQAKKRGKQGLMIDRLLTSYQLAYADDIILVSTTPRGLQYLLILLILPDKGQPKQKNCVIQQRSFKISSLGIPSVETTDSWTYLGITFNPTGRTKSISLPALVPLLSRLTQPNPQQLPAFRNLPSCHSGISDYLQS